MTSYVVSSGVISSGLVLTSGDTLTVLSGGTANSITVTAGGSEIVSSGGIAISTTVIDFGAVLTVEGSATSTFLSSGGEDNVFSGGVAVSTTMTLATAEQIYSGGITSAAVISSGGGQFVYSAGSSIGTVVSFGGGEYAYVNGSALDTTVESGGVVLVQPTGVVTNVTVQAGGQIVSTGVAVYTPATGVQLIGAVASGDNVGGGEAREYVLAGGTAVSNTIQATVDQEVYSGGSTLATLVSSGGTERVESGATAIATTVASGGLERILFSGFATGAAILSSGFQTVSNGAIAQNTTIIGGQQLVSNGGLARNTTVAGGYELVSSGASAINTTMDGTGAQWIDAGGVASGATIGAGGYQEVFSGSTAIATTVSSGGTEYAYSGDVVSGTTLSSGGFVDLTYLAYASGGTATLDSGTDVLTVDVGGVSATLSLAGDYAGDAFQLGSDGSTGTDVATISCFARGTLILTARGEVAVEDLRVGDKVTTHAGGTRPIVWIGCRDILCARHAHPEQVRPVKVSAHAFGANLPHRDLRLSPDHAIFTEGVLVPVRYLINGGTIRQLHSFRVTYFHIELESHDVVFANGLPAESYLDTGDRDGFSKPSGAVALHPAFGSARGDIGLGMDALGFAPLRVTGAEVEAAKARLRLNATTAVAVQGAKPASIPA